MTTTTAVASPSPADGELKKRAQLLGLHGLLEHWGQFADWSMLPILLEYEETERQRRSLERRIRNARIGRFKPMADFDWSWPKEIDRESVEELLRIGFTDEVANVVLVGPNGIGKTMIAQNIAYQALLRGHTVKFVTASEMLNDLAAQDTSSALARRVRRYCRPTILAIDEVG